MYSITLCQFNLYLQSFSLCIGVTSVDPDVWDGDSWPADLSQTWCVAAKEGSTAVYLHNTANSVPWRDNGEGFQLCEGNVLSVRLSGDRTVSISHRGTGVSHMYTNLSPVPVWLVTNLTVTKDITKGTLTIRQLPYYGNNLNTSQCNNLSS